ncbi:MAG: GDYXXLXY domain-containing protein, partial [Pusillimonas sp.]
QAGPATPALIGLMATALMYRVYTAGRADLAIACLAAAAAFFLLAIPLIGWVESEGSLLLVIVALVVLAGLALRQLGRLIRAAAPASATKHIDTNADTAAGLDPWYISLFRLAVMGLTAILVIVFLFMTLDPGIEQLWMAGLVVCAAGLLILKARGSVVRELGTTLAMAGLGMAGVGLYALDETAVFVRAGGAMLLGLAVYALAAGAALRFLCAFFTLALVCTLTWPEHQAYAPFDLLEGGPAWHYLPAYLRLWWLAVAGVLALAVASRAGSAALWLPLAWALVCLAQAMTWIAPSPTLLGLGQTAQQAPGLLLIWVGCALLPVLAMAALLWRERDVPRWLRVAAPAALAVASLGWMGAPGVSMALLWLVLGYALSQRALLVFAVLALLTYLGRFYYQMDASLLQKSLVLGLTGAWLLLSWRTLRAKAAAPSAAHDQSAAGPPPASNRRPGHLTASSAVSRPWALAGLWVGLAAVLLTVNGGIYQREQILAQGRQVVLALAPVDPRSLMQGDYMALRFAAEQETRRLLDQAAPQVAQAIEDRRGGWLVLRPDPDGVHHVRAVLASPDQHSDSQSNTQQDASGTILEFRLRNGRMRIVTDAWFFPEGQAARYEQARYGEFRVDSRGVGLLTGLLDEQRRPLP